MFNMCSKLVIVIFVYHQNGEYLANSYGAQWRVPTNCILYVFTLMLVLLSYNRFISRLGPTFEKIAFNFRHVTLRTFRSLVGGILENS